MNEAPGKVIVEAEQQVQAVLSTLRRFQQASVQLEEGRESLYEVAQNVEKLVDQASQAMQPALEAVAALRRLDPDQLLTQVKGAAYGVQEQLSRMEQKQAGEMERTRAAMEAAAAEITGISKSLPEAIGRLEAELGVAKAAAASNRPILIAAVGVGVINVVLLLIMLLMR